MAANDDALGIWRSSLSTHLRDTDYIEGDQTELFQNLEKLIASAVAICRLDGSLQCQIGGLITVIEELQRLLRYSILEIKRLEKTVDYQKQNFDKTISDLQKQIRSIENSNRNNNLSPLSPSGQSLGHFGSVLIGKQVSPVICLVDESYGNEEESDTSIPSGINNQPEENEDILNKSFCDSSEDMTELVDSIKPEKIADDIVAFPQKYWNLRRAETTGIVTREIVSKVSQTLRKSWPNVQQNNNLGQMSKITPKNKQTKETKPVLAKEKKLSDVGLVNTGVELDFLLGINQIMSDLVSSKNQQEATIDNVRSQARKYVVKLANLYRLRVHMAKEILGESPIVLVKRRDSCLPKPGELDKILSAITDKSNNNQSSSTLKSPSDKSKLLRKHKMNGHPLATKAKDLKKKKKV